MEYAFELLKVLLALLIVLAIFYAIVKFMKDKRNLFNQTNQLQVLEKCYLSTDHILYLVKVVDKVWLLSSTKEKIEFIEEIDTINLKLQEKGESTLLKNSKD
ncbi:flagellar protein FliO/FliZ [Orenia metallireducens]|jgi:flagellar protein FliO/FliZ|uniref:Flagellar protein FliO/FliZ n=1 Tax=Orenia metallireducens TaxID=1413210 RepID=A0A285FPJ9_9FIRM|nr:flagellar biosynthetic protein FliO [Orenia metallireducens]PRX33662.1 flagellar protein FliO/FliZ [Orenia metallireducens]SNY13013.1 flagellar protein FliO/FliZ [Orenia metallireducens]